jgi:hypothetical protein
VARRPDSLIAAGVTPLRCWVRANSRPCSNHAYHAILSAGREQPSVEAEREVLRVIREQCSQLAR